MQTVNHTVELCVVGGGLAGMSAAITAARRGVKTLLMHDRPVLGGNASSEIRMWICGAHGKNMRETGIIEEIQLDNRHRNPASSYAVWNEILYGKVAFQKNLTLVLNCSCLDATMTNNRIASIKGWQLTTETWHQVVADYFVDCSGDSILAPLSGAEFRLGREAESEFDEDIAPATADDLTMGMSCLLQARETERPHPFIPPEWAYEYPTENSFPHAHRGHDFHNSETNFWWLEIGGEADSVHDAEKNRDELLKIAYGLWDHIKNQGDHGAENWLLEWVGFLPGKRESRRYVGDHILTQNDVRAEGRFKDIIAYGGWPMDDHHPAGFRHPGQPTIFHPAPSPFGIPYRCLYSRTVANLWFAGRNISATHAALSSTRVMATCATLGQAVGTAAALAVDNHIDPRDVGTTRINELQQALMQDDCYLPWMKRQISDAMRQAELSTPQTNDTDPEPLRSGVDRPVGNNDNAWQANIGDTLTVRFKTTLSPDKLRLVFDSNLADYPLNMPAQRPLDYHPAGMPKTLVRAFTIEIMTPNQDWHRVAAIEDNHQRLVRLKLPGSPANAIRLTIDATWGDPEAKIFALDLE